MSTGAEAARWARRKQEIKGPHNQHTVSPLQPSSTPNFCPPPSGRTLVATAKPLFCFVFGSF